MNFTAKDVQTLRERTGVGMMDCKKALTESDGDMEKAIDILREKGLAAAAKKSGRIAAEGMVYAYAENKVGVVIEVNSETDFVAKNEDFRNFVMTLAAIVAAKNPADVDALKALPYSDTMTVEEALRDKILVIGENMNIRRFARYEGDCVSYVHGGGRIGVLVRFEADAAASGSAELEECGKDVAMQIAALNAMYLDQTTIPAADLAKEKDIQIALIKNDEKNAKKPDAIIEKMVEGKMRKFFENNCLLQQAFVKDGEMNVAKYVESMAAKAGGAMKVAEYVRFEKGEGMQKREDDFAAEVAAMAK